METNRAIPVLLSLSGAASGGQVGEETESVDLMTTGMLTPGEGEWTLAYTETQPDDSASSKVTLTISPCRVTMTRAGDFGTSMVFMKDRRFEGAYHTPYGDLGMAVFATRVDVHLSPEKGSVLLEYQLDLQGAFAAMHTLRLEYTAQAEGQMS